MKIKSKIWIGSFFLYFIILLMGGLGISYMLKISAASEKIIRDNYLSLEASKVIIRNLDEMNRMQLTWFFDAEAEFDRQKYQHYSDTFEIYLRQEEGNITEEGEKEAALNLRMDYEELKDTFGFFLGSGTRGSRNYFLQIAPVVYRLRSSLNHVADINMEAIRKKNEQAKLTSHRAVMTMTLIASICFLVTFSFVVNFPSLANPIRDLTGSIREIARKNYKQRLEYSARDEFGELSEAFNSMAEKLQEYESSNLARIIFEKKRIETIIRSMPDPVIGLDEDSGILFANPAATDVFGLSDLHLVGKKLSDLARINEVAKVLYTELLLPPSDREKKQNEWLKIGVPGQELFFSKEYLEVTGKEGHSGLEVPLGYVIIMNDITEFRKQDAAKTNFLATVSHELKTPIATIKMCLRLLEDKRVGQLNTEQDQLVLNIRKESERLTRITSELLNLAQIEAGKILLRIGALDLNKVINTATLAMSIQAEKLGVQIQTQLSGNLPLVLADEDKLEWVIVNLLSNAIQHSPSGSTVTLIASRKGNFAEIAVSDQGEGIPEEHQQRLFEKYYQVPGGKKDGTGLGLAICREFITAMKGFIGVQSETGKGSTFRFTLPVSQS